MAGLAVKRKVRAPRFAIYFLSTVGNNIPMFTAVATDIKFNCDLSDAQYWGYFSICGLLMRYRDLFRSELGLEPWATLDRAAIARWIQQKEARWPELEEQMLRDLELNGTVFSPFDAGKVNAVVGPQGYVYGAGYGMYLKPTFFLARLLSETEQEGHRVLMTGQELVRDLFTTPAMVQDRTIYLRLDPLKAMLWDRYVQLAPGRCTAMTAAFESFDIRAGQTVDRTFEDALETMARAYAGVLLRHELAESRLSVPRWKSLLASVQDRKAELYLRAVQDLVADTENGGPLHAIIEAQDERLLTLFVGLLDGFRRLLAPELNRGYGLFVQERRWPQLDELRSQCLTRLRAVRQELLQIPEGTERALVLSRLRELMPA
jgi:hypothetical protein